MKPPGWIVVVEGPHFEGDEFIETVRLSRFFWLHPGFWWYLLRPQEHH